jgi:hypothetical protein
MIWQPARAMRRGEPVEAPPWWLAGLVALVIVATLMTLERYGS